MIVHDVPRREVIRIAALFDLECEWRGRGVALVPHGNTYATQQEHKTTHFDKATNEYVTERRVICCRHGYEAVIYSILDRHPHAVIETLVTVYNGLADFQARQDDVRRALQQKYGDEICTCMGAHLVSTLPDNSPGGASGG